MVKTTEVVYKYVEGEFAVKHKKDGFKANSTRVLIGYPIAKPRVTATSTLIKKCNSSIMPSIMSLYDTLRPVTLFLSSLPAHL